MDFFVANILLVYLFFCSCSHLCVACGVLALVASYWNIFAMIFLIVAFVVIYVGFMSHLAET